MTLRGHTGNANQVAVVNPEQQQNGCSDAGELRLLERVGIPVDDYNALSPFLKTRAIALGELLLKPNNSQSF